MMILVTGGSGSGKSAFAEDQVVSFGEAERVYIATMFPFDEESQKKECSAIGICEAARGLRPLNATPILHR